MTRKNFMSILETRLRHIPITERKDILEDYTEHFNAGMESGKSEEEICEALGDPIKIAKQYTATSFAEASTKNNSAKSALKAIIAALGLGFFNLIVGLPVLIFIITLVIVFYSVAASIFVTGLALALCSLLFPFFSLTGVYIIISIFGGIALMALGLLMIIGSTYFTKYTFIGIAKYIKANFNLIVD
ncbi:MAG: DUF1700 domain-containing protein [Clostridia bacterium]|nr:DUF1700 domain-containing protein [Clostridia bacterium]